MMRLYNPRPALYRQTGSDESRQQAKSHLDQIAQEMESLTNFNTMENKVFDYL